MRSPSRCGRPVRFAITVMRGARHSILSRAARRRSAAGAMSGVWNAALTFSGITRLAPAACSRFGFVPGASEKQRQADSHESERGLGVLGQAQLVVGGRGEEVAKIDVRGRRALVAQGRHLVVL